MADKLASKSDRVSKSNSVYSVVESSLERDDESITSSEIGCKSLLIVVVELLLHNAVVSLELLLLCKLLAVVSRLLSLCESRASCSLHCLGMSTNIDPKSSALLKSRSKISSHDLYPPVRILGFAENRLIQSNPKKRKVSIYPY